MSTNTQTLPSWEEIQSHLPKTTSLYFVDYRDNLDDNTDLIEQCLENGSLDPLDELTMDLDTWESLSYYKSEIRDSLENDYDRDTVNEIMETYDDYIRDHIYNVDNSEPVKDLLRNTSDQTMFYDTGYYVESESWCWTEKEVRAERSRIKKHLGLKGLSDHDNKAIEMMIRQASYGGELVIYFCEPFEDFCQWDNGPEPKGIPSHIIFRDMNLAIINMSNGSGDHCQITGSCRLPYQQNNVKLCKSYGYSYTFRVCGMSSDWCAGTDVEFDWKGKKAPKDDSPSTLDNIKEYQKKCEETFKAGGCTAGDMNITRHRRTKYINQYPCGTRCEDCGTFWID